MILYILYKMTIYHSPKNHLPVGTKNFHIISTLNKLFFLIQVYIPPLSM